MFLPIFTSKTVECVLPVHLNSCKVAFGLKQARDYTEIGGTSFLPLYLSTPVDESLFMSYCDEIIKESTAALENRKKIICVKE